MLPVISSILDLVMTGIKSFLPGTPEDKLKALELALQEKLAANQLLTKQMDVNIAEAANPNRTWATWRECLGYILVFAVGYQWVVLPVISLIAQAFGHALDLAKIYTFDILDVLYLMCGMLGLDVGPIVANKVKNPFKKPVP